MAVQNQTQTKDPLIVRTNLLNLRMEVSTGSATQINTSCNDSGGFLARYSPSELQDLIGQVQNTASSWFAKNPPTRIHPDFR